MGWRSRAKKGLFSGREIVPVRISPNTVRYEARKVESIDEEPVITRTRGPVYAQGPGSYRKPIYTMDEYEQEENYWRNGRRVWDTEKPKKEYTFSASKWSYYNFNSWITRTDEDDNSKLMIKEPESYLTPTADEIRAKVSVFERNTIDYIKELARVCYFKMIDDRDYWADAYKDHNNIPTDYSTFNVKKEVFESVFNEFIPGYTPFEQAIAIHYKIMDEISKKKKGKNSGIFTSVRVAFDREAFSDAVMNDLVNRNPYAKDKRIQVLDKVSIISGLGHQFTVEKEIGEKVVANSDKHKKKIMRDYEQLTHVDIYQRFLPNFNARFITKNLIVNTPVAVSEKKQKIIMIVDYSGSMSDRSKQDWVNAIMIDRLKYVVKGEAEIFFSFFVSNPADLKFYHLYDKESAEKFWSKIFSNYPSGGQTDMGRIVNFIADEVKRKRLHNLKVDLSSENPEILIINDGQDRVSGTFNYKVNAVSLMQFSDQLKNLCIDTGGKQVRVREDGEIITYSSEGETTLT